MKRMRLILLILATALPIDAATAQSETDRLREALRVATAQLRTAEDQSAALQAKAAQLETERDRLRGDLKMAKARIREVEKDYRTAVKEFNERLTQRDETLEKWKSAYAEAAAVARTKDAERAKFEGDAKAYEGQVKSLKGKNTELVKVGSEVLSRLENITCDDVDFIREPLIGIRRVDHQNLIEDFRTKILDNKEDP